MDYHEAADRIVRVEGWEDMKQFGIQILTGEACGIGMRMLFDLSEKGCKLLEDFFGSCLKFQRGSNWNSKVENEEAVASVMLTVDILPELAAFCLLCSGCDAVAVHVVGCNNYAAVGFKLKPFGKYLRSTTFEEITAVLQLEPGTGFRTYHVMGTRGTRNLHCASGRVS